MALELRQQLKLSQQLIMTPQLQMAIKLLQLSRLELLDTIQQELEENPALEEAMESEAPNEPTEEPDPVAEEPPQVQEVTIEEKIHEDLDWSNFIEEYNTPGRTSYETERGIESPGFEPFVARKDSLQDHLLWQLLMCSPTEEQEQIGSLITGNLNRDGYLDSPLEEIARIGEVDLETAEAVLALMQGFDPVGICARDLSECLMIQIRHFAITDSLVTEIITDHLNHLENRNYKAICKALKASREEIASAINIIRSLEPRPGRQFSDDTPQYITPDIYVYKLGDEFIIMVNDDGMPKLRVNAYYRNALKRGEKISDSAKDYVQEKMRSAAWLIRSIHQRQKTIYRVMESILRFQRDFFDSGIAHLKPMVLRDVAEDIGMHESTISRVTTNKYAHTPQGIFELKYFFNSSIRRVNGDDIASASVQEKIRQIIDGENNRRPLSDDKIAKLLKAKNINIARRTVAKYREIMKILPSNKRKQL
jgi:RNA polymerase sigma-54 factor